MKSFIEVIKEADETQAKLKFIQDPKSSSKSIANLTRNKDPVVRNAAEEELKHRRDSGDQDAAAHVQPPKDASIHTAQTQVGGEQAQAQEKETKTKEVDPNRIAPVKKGSGRDILNNLKKGKTISGDAPNAIELNPQYIIRADGIKEAAMKSVVFSFGRMNPPTIGHEKLVDKIQAVAKANKADARLFLSRTEGDEKNPLPYSDKLKLAKMAFPGIVQDTPKSMYPAGFIGLLKMLEDKYDKVIIVVGSDRLPNIKALATKYNGTEYKFEEIEVVSAGERDPDEEGVGGMSASKMRAAAKAGDLVKFKSGLPSRLKSAAKLVMDKLQSYLSEDLDEAVLSLSQRLKRRSQFRRARGKIILGQKRARARKASSKQISKRSKRIAIKLMRKRILRNRKYQDLSYGARAAVDRQIARRKSAIARIAKRIEPKLRQAENRRKIGGGYASISLSGPVRKKKLKEEITYDNLIQSVNNIMKQIIAEENYSLAPMEYASLIKKSNETGVPVEVIKEVYNRGVASWNMGLRENTTPQQWGFARVNSFLAGGFNAHTADKDLLEKNDLAVGNQPTVNPKPVHHKASGHKFHIHHMINPNLGMTHQVKHAVDRKDLDIDGDTDQFDKPKAGIPDEIGVGTTPITKKMFAKYSKELAHIHAGEPVDEQKITPKYTGDENSWYLDASGQKVRVYSQSDLKHPEDVGKFLKNPTPEKDIGPMMSMKDFLKTQPEKKKK
jgi:hypothetical protein